MLPIIQELNLLVGKQKERLRITLIFSSFSLGSVTAFLFCLAFTSRLPTYLLAMVVFLRICMLCGLKSKRNHTSTEISI